MLKFFSCWTGFLGSVFLLPTAICHSSSSLQILDSSSHPPNQFLGLPVPIIVVQLWRPDYDPGGSGTLCKAQQALDHPILLRKYLWPLVTLFKGDQLVHWGDSHLLHPCCSAGELWGFNIPRCSWRAMKAEGWGAGELTPLWEPAWWYVWGHWDGGWGPGLCSVALDTWQESFGLQFGYLYNWNVEERFSSLFQQCCWLIQYNLDNSVLSQVITQPVWNRKKLELGKQRWGWRRKQPVGS